MEFDAFYERWLLPNFDELKSIIVRLASTLGVKCDPKQVLGNVQARLLWLELNRESTRSLWGWIMQTFRAIRAEVDLLRFHLWWIGKHHGLRNYAAAVLSGYHTQQDVDDLLHDSFLLIHFRIKKTHLDRLDFTQIEAYAKRVIRNWFTSGFRKRRECALPEDFDAVDPRSAEAFDQVSGGDLREKLWCQMELYWKEVALTPNEMRALRAWIQSDFARQTAFGLLGVDKDDKKAKANEYDSPLCSARSQVSLAFAPLDPLVRELGLVKAAGHVKAFLLSKLAP